MRTAAAAVIVALAITTSINKVKPAPFLIALQCCRALEYDWSFPTMCSECCLLDCLSNGGYANSCEVILAKSKKERKKMHHVY